MYMNAGRCKVYGAKLDVDGNIGKWRLFDTPKEDTTIIETNPGDKKEWFEEGHVKVDEYQKVASYTLKFEMLGMKDRKKPIEDVNGVITDNYAFRIIPEDESCFGIFLPRCSVSCEETWSAAEGTLWKYSCASLKSPDFVELMDYFKESEHLWLSDNFVALAATASEEMVSAQIGAGTTITTVIDTADNWISTEVSGDTVTVSVTANQGEKRSAFITIKTDDGKSELLKVIQAAGNI